MITEEEVEKAITWLRENISYDPQTGLLRCIKPRRGIRVGQVVGTKSKRSESRTYLVLMLSGKKYFAHRAAWMIHYGESPNCDIDHINGDGTDNRICNLRLASRKENSGNRGKSPLNTSGYKGVSYCKRTKGFIAQVGNKHLGYFKDAEKAYEAYCVAAAEYFGDFARVK